MGDLAYGFPKGTSEAQKDAVYQDVINEQVKIVKELVPPDQSPVFHFTLYGEMLKYYQAGKLSLPPEVILVWPDNLFGRMRALPNDGSHKLNGVYYHLAFCPSTLQMTHAVPPPLIASQFRDIVAAKATDLVLVNVSEEREYVKELRMIADICWDAPGTLSGPDPADRYIAWFCREYFGEKAAPCATEACRWYNRLIDNPNRLRYASEILHKQLLPDLQHKFQDEAYQPVPRNELEELKKRNADYERAMKVISKASRRMNRQQRQYFFENITLGLLIDYRPTQAALKLQAALAEPDREKALDQIEAALSPLSDLEIEILRAERPPFEQWYRETWARPKGSPFDLHRSYQDVRALLWSLSSEAEPQEP